MQEVWLAIEAAAEDEDLAIELAKDLANMTVDEARGLKKALAWRANRRQYFDDASA